MHRAHGDEERPTVAKGVIFESVRQALKNELGWIHVEKTLKLDSMSKTPVTQTKPVGWRVSGWEANGTT